MRTLLLAFALLAAVTAIAPAASAEPCTPDYCNGGCSLTYAPVTVDGKTIASVPNGYACTS